MRYVLWAAIVAVLVLGAIFLTMKDRERQDAARDPAPPAVSPLADTAWVWSELRMPDGELIVPYRAASFEVRFAGETVQGTTDCNGFSGSYSVEDTALSFGPFASTKMYCEDSQEDVFIAGMQSATSYYHNTFGQLVLTGESGVEVVLDRLGS